MASASSISHVKTLEAAVIAEKAAREKQLAAMRERAERRREADPRARSRLEAEWEAVPIAGGSGV